MRVRLWGARGSIPVPGSRAAGFGGNTSCVQVTAAGLGQNLSTARANWISGHALARDASLLIHDCRYAEDEYGAHRGWGHPSLPDTLAFARRCEPHHVLLFPHDPAHDDAQLEALQAEAIGRWLGLGGERPVEMAREGRVIDRAA